VSLNVLFETGISLVQLHDEQCYTYYLSNTQLYIIFGMPFTSVVLNRGIENTEPYSCRDAASHLP
jgi:hypothetical protein